MFSPPKKKIHFFRSSGCSVAPGRRDKDLVSGTQWDQRQAWSTSAVKLMMTMVIIGDFTAVSWDITRYNPPVIVENCTHFVNCTHKEWVERWKQCHALSDIRLGSGSCNHHWTPSCLPAREAANKAGVRLNLGSPIPSDILANSYPNVAQMGAARIWKYLEIIGMYLPHSACPHSQHFPANLLGLAFLGASRLEKLLSRFNNILFGSQLLQILFVTMHVSPFVPEYVLSFEIVLPRYWISLGKKKLWIISNSLMAKRTRTSKRIEMTIYRNGLSTVIRPIQQRQRTSCFGLIVICFWGICCHSFRHVRLGHFSILASPVQLDGFVNLAPMVGHFSTACTSKTLQSLWLRISRSWCPGMTWNLNLSPS